MSLYNFTVDKLNGERQFLADYKGKVLLIVNTASKCGFTPQYAGLQLLYERFQESGLEILAFPCNQFGHQEPGTSPEIQRFCEETFHVTFPIFAKIDVNGPSAHPLYQYLKSEARGLMGSQKIKWNFTKFLVNRQGEVVKRYAPNVTPTEIEPDVADLLAANQE